MMKKLALLLAMSGVSFVANGAELLIEAVYRPLNELYSTRYETICKIYDNGKATVDLNKYDYDTNAVMEAVQAANSTNIDYNQFKKNNKTIISTNTTFKIDKGFLKEVVNEAVLYEVVNEAVLYDEYPSSSYGLSSPISEFFVYKNKKKVKAAEPELVKGTSGPSMEQRNSANKLSTVLSAICNQHGLKHAVKGCGMGGDC